MAQFRTESVNPVKRGMSPEASAPQRLLLRGRIVTMNGNGDVIPDGFLGIEGDSIKVITPIGTPLPNDFQQLPVIQTGGTLYPGLIELHNHPAYNAIPLWGVKQQYPSRDVWRQRSAL